MPSGHDSADDEILKREQRIKDIRDKIDALISAELDAEVQMELAAIITGILPFLNDHRNYVENIKEPSTLLKPYRQSLTAVSECTLVSSEDLPTSILAGIMRICIGVAFGMLVYMVLAGEVISIAKLSITEVVKAKYIVAALCFAAGFRERFWRSMLDQLQKRLIG